MTVDFGDFFWGDKNNGFSVLYHNMKYGLVASKDLADFLRERSSIEESNSKMLAKLAKQAGAGCIQGTFAPVWGLLRSSAERLLELHIQMVHKVSELVKDVTKYADELQKKHKLVKEEEGGTLDAVQAIQTTTVTLHKAKEVYTQKSLDLERLRKENASAREVEKAEAKVRKAQEEYRALVEKYSAIKEEFEKRMYLACRRFQDVEESYLVQMKNFLNTYAELLQHNHELIGQVHTDFKRQCLEMTVDKLLDQFVRLKKTGSEKPGSIEFEEASVGVGVKDSPTVSNTLSGTPVSGAPVSGAATNANSNTPPSTGGSDGAELKNGAEGKHWKREGFLRSRRRKDKKAKKKKDGSTDNTSQKSDGEEKSGTPTPEVDDEGYNVRPKSDTWDNDKASFYSSSDTDSEDERERKIHVEIKPLSNGSAPMSASVDELRATVENLSLSPIGTTLNRRGSAADTDNPIKRSQSVSQQLGKPSSDLLGLSLFQSPTTSAASTPTGNHPYAPLTSPPLTSASPSASPRYPDVGEFVGDVESQPALPPKQRQNAGGANLISIPRPPSRRSEPIGSRGRVSPGSSTLSMSRADSAASLEFRAAGVPVGASRGPSPLTIGMTDTIPLAVAFHEIVHCYFRGTDETRCQVKLSGDMMVSFPAGIVAVLTTNPSPAQLTFRIRNTQRLETILPNKQIVNIDNTQNNGDSMLFEFNMGGLTGLLRRQAEQNPSASYFNVDILKYQVRAKNGAASCPFQLVAYWKCESTHTDLKVDYKYNSHAMASPSPLLNVTVAVPVDGGVTSMQSKPSAQWVAESNRVLWKFTELSQHSDNHGVGSLKARLEVSNGPSSQGTIATQFNCEGTTLSGIELDLVGSGYRLSLVKRRFVSGKYICDGDPDSRSRYAAPPGS